MIWDFYRQLYTIRRTEETLLDIYSRGLLFGTVHTCIGQEPVAVGVVGAMDPEKDVVWSNHRGHGHYIAFSDDVEGLIAEVMGRSTGVCGGIGGTQHLHGRNFYTNGVLGGTVACAVGSALAEKERGEGGMVAVFFGDGALAEGIVYESMNLAALWELPILFVLENNGIAQTTPSALAHAGDLATRADTFGIPSRRLEAADVMDVHRAAAAAVDSARSNSSPYFLVLDTYRLKAHSKGDDTRSQAEVDALRGRDPLQRLADRLSETDADRKSKIEDQVEQRISAAVEAAVTAPFQDPVAWLEVAA